MQMSINAPACLSEEHFFIVEMSDWKSRKTGKSDALIHML